MRTSTQLDYDLCRVLLYRRDASELLLESKADGLGLPVVPVLRFRRVAEELTAGIKDRWNLDTCCLFPVLQGISSPLSIPFHVVELSSREAETPAAMRWMAATSLSAAEFRDHDDFVAVQASLVRIEGFRRGELPGAFGKPGWPRTVTEWVAERAATVGLSLTRKFRQLNASATFSLVRFETDGPALWFKAVGEPNVHEFPITLAVARLFPHFVPRVIGHRADWNAWLSVEAEGTHLSGTAPLSNWQQAAATLANLQIASCGHGLRLIDAGSKDIRICSLVRQIEPFFERIAELMELQTKPTPLPLDRAEIRSLSENVRWGLDELNAVNIPNTLGHLDFNPDNILVSPEQCVFLDWAEIYVGHPSFTFQYLLEHWRRFHGIEPDREKILASSYALPWRAVASADEIAKCLRLAPLLAAFACAAHLNGRNPNVCRRPDTAAYLRGLVRRMKRESDALRERRVTCVA
jgi:hypothetical protein